MDKLELISKEIKEYRQSLNNLYRDLKIEIDKNKLREIQSEINDSEYVLDILKDLKNRFTNNNGDEYLSELTIKNDEDYTSIINKLGFHIGSDVLSLDIGKIYKLKKTLDNINEVYLSKEEIYDYLYHYNEVFKIARQDLFTSFYDVFLNYMKKIDNTKANFIYYKEMIRLHTLFDSMMLSSIIKDEDYDNIIPSDNEMHEKDKNGNLAYLADGFINPLDKTRFKKYEIFNYVRNAIFHNDINELYKINTDCMSLTISLSNTNPVPFKFRINSNEINKMVISISDYSHHAIPYLIKKQGDFNINSFKKNYNHAMKEIKKLVPTRIVFKNNSKDNKREIMKSLYHDGIWFSQKKAMNLIDNYCIDYEEKSYEFSSFQKDLFYKKINYFMRFIDGSKFKHFICPIIYNYMAGGVHKYEFYQYDYLISSIYLADGTHSVYSVMNDVLYDFAYLSKHKKVPDNKESIYNYMPKDVDITKSLVLYMFDYLERENMNDSLLFTYSLCNFSKETDYIMNGKLYELEHIRNAFTHNRWVVNYEGNIKYYYLYDDEDVLVKPTDAIWQNKYTCEELYKLSKVLKDNSISKSKKMVYINK